MKKYREKVINCKIVSQGEKFTVHKLVAQQVGYTPEYVGFNLCSATKWMSLAQLFYMFVLNFSHLYKGMMIITVLSS